MMRQTIFYYCSQTIFIIFYLNESRFRTHAIISTTTFWFKNLKRIIIWLKSNKNTTQIISKIFGHKYPGKFVNLQKQKYTKNS